MANKSVGIDTVSEISEWVRCDCWHGKGSVSGCVGSTTMTLSSFPWRIMGWNVERLSKEGDADQLRSSGDAHEPEVSPVTTAWIITSITGGQLWGKKRKIALLQVGFNRKCDTSRVSVSGRDFACTVLCLHSCFYHLSSAVATFKV